MSNRILNSFIIIFLLQTTFAQNSAAVTELLKVRNAYIQATKLSFDVEVYSYKDKFTKKPQLVSKGTAIKFNEKYYSSFLKLDLIIFDKNSSLIIDHDEKKMDYYVYDLKKEKTPKEFQLNFDSLALASDSIKVGAIDKGIKKYTMYTNNSLIIQTELYIDVKTNYVQRILYFYASSDDYQEIEVDRLDIYYKNISTNVLNTDVFNSDLYFKKNGKNSVIVSQKYKGYTINYLNYKS